MRRRWLAPGEPLGNLLLAARMRWELACWDPSDAEERAVREAIGRVAPRYTMMALPRLRRLVEHARCLHRRGIAGAVVECGTWRGGSLALVDWAFRRLGENRPLWAFDSFAGCPQPGPRDPPRAHREYYPGFCGATLDEFYAALDALATDRARLSVVPGWIEATLPGADVPPIALLNVDVDWYEPVAAVLEHLYDRVVTGGIVNFDDLGRWQGCDAAVDDFLAARGLPRSLLERTGRHGGWLVKP